MLIFGPKFANSDCEQSCPSGISTLPNFSSIWPLLSESLIRLETSAKILLTTIVSTYAPIILLFSSYLYFKKLSSLSKAATSKDAA